MNATHLNLYQVCRLCLSELNGSSFVPIFDNRDSNLPHKIKSCFSISVSKDFQILLCIIIKHTACKVLKIHYHLIANACACCHCILRNTRYLEEARVLKIMKFFNSSENCLFNL